VNDHSQLHRLTTTITRALAAISVAFLASCAAPIDAQTVPCSTSCTAPLGGGTIFSNATSNQLFLGIQRNFGDSRWEVVLGDRHTVTESSNFVYGEKYDLAFPVTGTNAGLPVVRVLGLRGDRNTQFEFGLGVATSSWQPLAALGIQTSYLNGGLNAVLGGGFKWYAGANTLPQASAPTTNNGTPSCPTGTLTAVSNGQFVIDATTYTTGPATIVDGYTCVIPAG
jgi:hypothetical protein